MSDPGTTYRTRDEVQRMRNTQDPFRGLQRYIDDEWGLASEEELKVGRSLSKLSLLSADTICHSKQFDKDAEAEVDVAVEEAKQSPILDSMVNFWTDIYYKGTDARS